MKRRNGTVNRLLRPVAAVLVAAMVATFTAVTVGAAPARADEPAGTIAGTITDNGTPVADATVHASSADGSFGQTTTTGPDGRYQVPDLPIAGSPYRVSVQAPGHPRQYAHGKTSWDSATLFPVTANQVTTVDEALLPTGTISGRFTDPAGNGIPVWVMAYDAEWTPTGAAADADGNYSISVLPGTYLVTFDYGNGQQYAYGTFDREQATRFTVAVGQTVTVNDVKLSTGTIDGRLTNADGTPAGGVQVTAEGDGSTGLGTTDDSGAYRIADLPPGAYRVSFQLPSGGVQWAHQVVDSSRARSFQVTAGETTTVDERLLPLGSIAGRFTDSAGAPMAGVNVLVEGDHMDGPTISATTDDDGTYRIDGIPAVGTYQVEFSHWQTGLRQYAHGKITREAADPITVVAGQTTTVDDRQLPTGSIRVTATDAVTGAAISRFWAEAGDRIVNTTNGSLVLPDLAAGTYTLYVGAADHFLAGDRPTVTVTAGQQTEVELRLQPYAKITTTITDRASGAPVADACVYALQVKTFVVEFGCNGQSDSTGAVTLRVREPGAYNVFVMPRRRGPHGAQWVGPSGGTGTQTAATQVTVAAGGNAPLAPVRLDPRGTITGTVTTADGGPVRNGVVGIAGPGVISGGESYNTPVAADGRYTIDWLGPYRWPLLFSDDAHPYQWSGGVGNRLAARLVPVPAGGTTSFDYRMKVGAKVRVTAPGAAGYARVVVRNAVTGDPMGVGGDGDVSTGVLVPVIGGQRVKVEVTTDATTRWYGGTDFASATPVWIPVSGTAQVAFPPAS